VEQTDTDLVIAVRPACEEDLDAGLALIDEEADQNKWLEPVSEIFSGAIHGTAGDFWACVGISDAKCVGVGVCGMVAGTVATGVIQAIVTAAGPLSDYFGAAILRSAVDVLRRHNARMITADVPDHSDAESLRSLLLAYGFVEECRIEDFYADGISLLHYRFDFK
jgi:hypothetical protein